MNNSLEAVHHKARSPLVAVTGATGYIGQHLCNTLSLAGLRVVPLVRRVNKKKVDAFAHCLEQRMVGDIAGQVDWCSIIDDIDVVIHAAGVAHLRDKQTDVNSLFHKVNVEATLNLAESAVKSGVSRFIMLSSAGVYGHTSKNTGALEEQVCQPEEAYAKAKLDAENGLMFSVLREMQIVILRPPMVYGPECPGNLQRFARVVRAPIAAPLGDLDGRRNLLSVFSLCDGILRVVCDEGDVSGVWNIAEPDQVSVPDVMQALGRGLYGKEVRIPAVPVVLVRVLAQLLGKGDIFEKLHAPVLINSSKFSHRFDWQPKIPTLLGIERAAKTFRPQR